MIGRRFGHYQILKKIGQGGMGEVYLADDTSLQRKVALKFLPADMQQDPSARQRLMREAKSAAALDHPFICHINEVGEADGKDFIVLEYVEGETLKERLAREPQPLKEALRLASEILEALEKAHEKRIVHRDLKPANIMLTREGHAKVMDFGLAKQSAYFDSAGSLEATLSEATQSGSISGTLAHMSPEQMRGQPVDVRSDLFSFGILLYEMLTGTHPFSRASAMDTASAILTENPPPLDHYKPGIPRRLQAITEKLVAKDTSKRYQSAREAHADLDQILPEQAVLAAPKHFRWAWLIAGLIILVFGVVPLSWRVRENHFRSPQVALAFKERDWILIADIENLTSDPVFDRSLQTALTIGIQQSKYVNVFPPVRVQEALERMRKDKGVRMDEPLACEVAVREGIKAVLVCSISGVGGSYSLTARLVEPGKRATVLSQTASAPEKNQVLSAFDTMIKSVRQNLGESLSSMSNQGLPLPKATTASLEALKTYAEGIRIKSIDGKASLDLIEQAVAADPDFALAHAVLGIECYRGSGSGGRVEGEEHFTKALSLMDRLTLRERLWIRAVIEDCRGESNKAAECYRTFLSQYPDDSDGWFRLGWIHMAQQGQNQKAIEEFLRVLEINPSSSSAYINIATCCIGLRQDKEARRNYEKAFELSPSAILGSNVNPEYGLTLVRLGELQKAAETFQKMIDTDDVSKKARGFRSMAFLAMYQGKLSDAIASFKRAILINKTEKISDSEFRDHLFLSSAYRLKGRDTDFIAELRAAERILSNESLDPNFIIELITIYARSGKIRDASGLVEKMTSQGISLTAKSVLNRTDRGDQACISMARGEIALAEGKAADAIEYFDHARDLEFRHLSEPLALAYYKLGKLKDAAGWYEQIISQFRLSGPLLEEWLLAHYQLANIYRERGDTEKAREYYSKFLNIWKDADPDIPILVRAKAEYSKLQ
jgi:serine/threonine protein kinase/tetratricopeptide (TPR) repeat protein